MDLEVKDCNYYGFDHEKVNENFPGGQTYLGTFSIRGRACAVYKVANPDKEKGHKEYMLLHSEVAMGPEGVISKFYVSGMTQEDIEKYVTDVAILTCLKCNDTIFSCDRHHNNYCSCKASAIDGGDLYAHINGNEVMLRSYDFLTKTVKEQKDDLPSDD